MEKREQETTLKIIFRGCRKGIGIGIIAAVASGFAHYSGLHDHEDLVGFAVAAGLVLLVF
jgi:hypothetical protein